MQQKIEFWELPLVVLMTLVIVAMIYLGVGYYVFWWAQRRTRQKGVLGHY